MTWEYEGHTGKVDTICIRSALVKGFVPDNTSVLSHNNGPESVTVVIIEKIENRRWNCVFRKIFVQTSPVLRFIYTVRKRTRM